MNAIAAGETSSRAPLLDMHDISIHIGNTHVVKNARLTVRAGETVGLVGESGSGKSMMCRAATGLLGPIGGRVSHGSLLIGGQPFINATTPEWRRIRGHTLGYVPQASLAGLDPLMRIGSQLRETIRALDGNSNAGARALELLEVVRINQPTEVLRAYPHQLSGGMRQRVMIALALAGRPELIIADEATTALDATVQKAVLTLLRDVQKETGMAMIVVTHDIGVVRQISNRLYVMNGGVTVESGPTESVLRAPRHEYTKGLLNADPSRLAFDDSPATATHQPQESPGARTALESDEESQ